MTPPVLLELIDLRNENTWKYSLHLFLNIRLSEYLTFVNHSILIVPGVKHFRIRSYILLELLSHVVITYLCGFIRPLLTIKIMCEPLLDRLRTVFEVKMDGIAR